MDSIGIPSEVVEAIRFIYSSDAWDRFFVPSLESIRNTWMQTIIDPSTKRKDEYSDDYLRGCIATINAFLELPKAVIDEADTQAARRRDEEAQAEHFRTRAELGTP